MAIWTVYLPEVAGDTEVRAAERAVFVPERFSWLALWAAPVVALGHRLWLVALAYGLVAALLALSVAWFDLPLAVVLAVIAGFNVLVALELPSMRQRQLLRAGYEEAGVVVARARDGAERRFFEGWTHIQPLPARPVIAASSAPRGQAAARVGVIGAFPDEVAR